MMIIKLVLYVSVFVLSTAIGILIAKKYKDRVSELKELKNALTVFETKIKYTYETIPEIFYQIKDNFSNNIAELFINAVNIMSNYNAGEAWNIAIDTTNLNINKEDKNVLKNLGKLLGKTDINGQIKQIELTNNFLDTQIQKAEIEKEKNEKLYKTLGMVMGAGMIIILL